MPYDPSKAEPRNASADGETAQESVDRMAGQGGNPPHPSSVAQPKAPGPKISPWAKGQYGAPIQPAIVK